VNTVLSLLARNLHTTLSSVMRKQRTLDISATNIANLGSDLDHKIKAASANKEPAWDNAGKEQGLLVWRIEKFHVKPIEKNTYGQFFSGDSYIVLHTIKQGDSFSYDIHFWLGDHTSQDEAGTAAYKTVELDEKLGGIPVQYREVHGHESERFISYFNPPALRVLDGGIESGFHHVKPHEYKARLFQVKGKGSHIAVHQVSLARDSLNSGDVFILDDGKELYQWNGKASSHAEKSQAAVLTQHLADEHGGHHTVSEEGDEPDRFWELLGGKGPIKSAQEGGEDSAAKVTPTKKLLKLSDLSGSLKVSEVATGKISRSLLNEKEVFITDDGSQVYVWIGKNASGAEKSKGLQYAEKYLKHAGHPEHLPIARIVEGHEPDHFNRFFR